MNKNIKKIIILLLLTLINSVPFTYCGQKNLISTDVLLLLSGMLNMDYEKAIDEKSSMSYGLGYLKWSIPDWDISAVGIEAAYYIFPSKKALKGFFVGPSAGLVFTNVKHTYEVWTYTGSGWRVEEKTDTANGTFVGIGGEGGYRWIWENNIVLSIGAAVGYILGEVKVGGDKLPYGGLSAGLSVKIGYAW